MSNLPFGFEKPEDSLGFLLWQTTITWQRAIKKILEPHELSHTQFVVMALLLWLSEHKFQVTQTLIAEWSKLDKMTISQALKKLAQRKLVKRAEHKKDTRAKTVTLTPEGKRLISHVVPLIEKTDETFFDVLSKPHHETLSSFLKRLVEQQSGS